MPRMLFPSCGLTHLRPSYLRSAKKHEPLSSFFPALALKNRFPRPAPHGICRLCGVHATVISSACGLARLRLSYSRSVEKLEPLSSFFLTLALKNRFPRPAPHGVCRQCGVHAANAFSLLWFDSPSPFVFAFCEKARTAQFFFSCARAKKSVPAPCAARRLPLLRRSCRAH